MRKLEFDRDHPFDDEEKALLRNVGAAYILWGAVDAKTMQQKGATEVTYTFYWEMTDVDSGNVVWSDEYTIRKNVK
jgi:PBP1b-binding outer membrane lipoprotein LpoB